MKSGVFFQMGFMRRFDAGYAAAKKRLDERRDRHGRRLQVDVARPAPHHASSTPNPKSSGGMILDMGIHDFDLARFFMGEVKSVAGHRRDARLPGARRRSATSTTRS